MISWISGELYYFCTSFFTFQQVIRNKLFFGMTQLCASVIGNNKFVSLQKRFNTCSIFKTAFGWNLKFGICCSILFWAFTIQ